MIVSRLTAQMADEVKKRKAGVLHETESSVSGVKKLIDAPVAYVLLENSHKSTAAQESQ